MKWREEKWNVSNIHFQLKERGVEFPILIKIHPWFITLQNTRKKLLHLTSSFPPHPGKQAIDDPETYVFTVSFCWDLFIYYLLPQRLTMAAKVLGIWNQPTIDKRKAVPATKSRRTWYIEHTINYNEKLNWNLSINISVLLDWMDYRHRVEWNRVYQEKMFLILDSIVPLKEKVSCWFYYS